MLPCRRSSAIVLIGALLLISEAGLAAELRRMPRVVGLTVGISPEAATRQLRRLGATDIRQRERQQRVGRTVRVKMLRIDARLPDGSPRLRLHFYRSRLVGVRVSGMTDKLKRALARLGPPDLSSESGRLWVDSKRLRMVGCRRSRCELADFRRLIGPEVSLETVRVLMSNISAKERRRHAPRPRDNGPQQGAGSVDE